MVGEGRSGPGVFDRLLWDYPARSIDPDTDRDLVVRRVTAEGGWREMSLLRSRVGDQAIREVIERTDARGLSPQRIRFWQLVLGLPARRADGWVRRARESTWARRARRWFREKPIDDPLRLAADLRGEAFRLEIDRVEKGMLLQRQSWPAIKTTIRGWVTGLARGRR